MGPRYVNTGARFKRRDGTWIQHDQVFEPTREELIRKAYKLRMASWADEPAPRVEPGDPEPEREPVPDNPDDIRRYHTGYGWYTLPGGRRVHGREAAERALSDGES